MPIRWDRDPHPGPVAIPLPHPLTTHRRGATKILPQRLRNTPAQTLKGRIDELELEAGVLHRL